VCYVLAMITRRRGDPGVSPYLTGAILDNGVALVTSAHRHRANVMTVSFFAESSHLPVLVRVAISPSCLTHQLVSDSGWFGLSVLGRGQESLALFCGMRSGREESKFEAAGLRIQSSPEGVPLLPDCLTTSACRVVERVELADHTLFVGEITTSFRQLRYSCREGLLVSDLIGPMTG